MSRTRLARLVLTHGSALAVAARVTPLAAQTTVTTEAGAVATSYSGGLIMFGQTFTVPNATDRLLTTFRVAVGFPPQTFIARLAVWDAANSRMGPVLWTGTDVTPLATAYRTFTVGQVLDAGTAYVFALTLGSGGIPVGTFVRFDNPYADGGAVFMDARTLPELQNGGVWSGPSATEDLGFTAEFQPTATTVTPEPSTWLLVGGGLVAVAGACARRRRRVAICAL